MFVRNAEGTRIPHEAVWNLLSTSLSNGLLLILEIALQAIIGPAAVGWLVTRREGQLAAAYWRITRIGTS